jgi:hypothetical protein
MVRSTSRRPRLHIGITRRTQEVLREVVATDGVSYAEAARRLVEIGAIIHRAVASGREIHLIGGGRPTEQLEPRHSRGRQAG